MSIGFSPHQNRTPALSQPMLPRVGTTPLQMNDLKRMTSGRIINASRLPLTLEQVAGLKDGQMVMLPGEARFPYTGKSWLDNRLSKLGDLKDYPASALSTLLSYLSRGILIGGVAGGFGSGILLGGLKGLGHLIKRGPVSKDVAKRGMLEGARQLKLLNLVGASMIFGFMAAVAGGGLGLLHAFYQNIWDLKNTLFD